MPVVEEEMRLTYRQEHCNQRDVRLQEREREREREGTQKQTPCDKRFWLRKQRASATTSFTHGAVLPPRMLNTEGVQHVDKLLHHRKRGLKVDDCSHWQEDLHEEGAHGILDLLAAAI